MALSAVGKNRNPKLQFEHRNRCSPDRFPPLRVKPLNDARIRFGVHELRNHIRIEDDHRNLAGRASSYGSLSSFTPMPRKSAAIWEPRPSGLLSDFSASASRRM